MTVLHRPVEIARDFRNFAALYANWRHCLPFTDFPRCSVAAYVDGYLVTWMGHDTAHPRDCVSGDGLPQRVDASL